MSKDSTQKQPKPSSRKATKGNIDYSSLETQEAQEDLRRLAEDYPNVVARRRAQMRGETPPQNLPKRVG